jgi:hypothetical protein
MKQRFINRGDVLSIIIKEIRSATNDPGNMHIYFANVYEKIEALHSMEVDIGV